MVADFTACEPELLAIISESVDTSTDSITPTAQPPFPLSSSSYDSSYDLTSLTPVHSLQQSTIANFTDMSTFEFNVLNVPDDYVSISSHIFGIFDNLLDLETLNVKKKVLLGFIRRTSRSYRTVPYHNFFHAFCVVQFTGALLVQWNLRQDLPSNEIFCLLVCALIHDVDHPGTNNSFEVATNSRLSILYNDISVLENHHIALGFSIMQSLNDYNIILHWTPSDQKRFREIAIHTILATDMACHNDLIKDITSRTLNTLQPFDVSQESERRTLYRILLHNADLSNTVRPFHISKRICSYIVEEFRNQSNKEAELGLTVTPFMILPDELSVAKAEIGFLQYVAKPYFKPQGLCFNSVTLVQELENNIDRWTERKIDLENKQ
jgi:hypothetical protein